MKASTPAHAGCAYCGLPLGPVSTAAVETDEPEYCCFGCRFAASVAGSDGSAAEAASGAQLRLGLAVFFAMNVMVFTMFLWSQPEIVTDPAAAIFCDVARYVCLLFSFPVVFLLGPTLALDAWQSLRSRRIAASLLLLIGVTAALVFSVYSVVRGQGHVYFEVACVVLVTVTLGRWMESQGKLRTTRSLRELESLLPKQVRRLLAKGEAVVDLEVIVCGDRLRLLAGERIPVDGFIVRGRAAIDEQILTGESVPCEKVPGEKVFSGTLNLDGELIVEATSAAGEGTLRRLVDTVTKALADQSSQQKLADRIAAWFLPIVTAVAIATFAIKLATTGLEASLMASLSVLVIACPCALGLATPMALWAAVGRSAQRQVLFRQGDALARLADAKVICFDKTGTLTTGQFEVERSWFADEVEQDSVLALVEPMTRASNHPISKSLAAHARQFGAGSCEMDELREKPGLGLQATFPEIGRVFVGSQRWLEANGIDCAAWQLEVQSDETSRRMDALVRPSNSIWQEDCVALVGYAGRIRAAFALREETRSEAAAAVDSLRKLGLEVRVLSGDLTKRAVKIVEPLGVLVKAELLPEEKLVAMRELRERFGPVIMVGDGLNDAPALAAADVGIVLGCGADLSRDAASVCLLTNQLDRIAWAIELARETTHVIRWNLFWAFFYNAVGVPLAALGIVNPILAAMAMGVSSMMVVSRSLRLVGPDASSGPDRTSGENQQGVFDLTSPSFEGQSP